MKKSILKRFAIFLIMILSHQLKGQNTYSKSNTLHRISTFYINEILGNEEVKDLENISLKLLLGKSTIFQNIDYKSRLVTIKGKIGQKSGVFILDTGSSEIVINAQYYTTQISKESRKIIGNSITGNSLITETIIEKIQIGNQTHCNIKADITDLTHLGNLMNQEILGLLGTSFLQKYDVVYNRKQGYTILTKPVQNHFLIKDKPRVIDSVDLEFIKGVPTISISIKGKPYQFVIDTGSEFCIITPTINIEFTHESQVIGVQNSSQRVKAGKINNITIGDKIKIPSIRSLVIQAERIEELYGKEVDGILGQNILTPLVFKLDYKSKKIYFFDN